MCKMQYGLLHNAKIFLTPHALKRGKVFIISIFNLKFRIGATGVAFTISRLRKYFSLKDNTAHINLYIYKKFI